MKTTLPANSCVMAGTLDADVARCLRVPARRESTVDDDDVKIPRTMDTFDALEFDVGGRRRAADHGGGALRCQIRNRLRHSHFHTAAIHDADVCVRYQCQRTASLRWTGVEEDGAGFGARYLRAGDNGVEVLEFRSRYVRAVHHQRSVESGYP